MMTGQRRIFLLVLGLLLSESWHAYAGSSSISFHQQQAEDSRPIGYTGYDVVVFGVNDVSLEKFVRQQSLLFKRRDNPPPTLAALKQLAMDDMEILQRALATQGYYDAELDYFVDTRQKPFRVYLKINLGKLYTVGAFKLKSDPPGNTEIALLVDEIESLGITLGQPGKAEYLRQAAEKALNQLQKHGYPFARLKVGGDRIVIDRMSKTVQAAFLITPGPLARFGDVQMDNVAGVTPEFLKGRLRWKRGDIYNEDKVLDTIEALYNTRLFKNIKIIHGDTVNPKTGMLDMHIRADSSPRNSVTGTGLYTSDKKHDATLVWENRNMRGKGELMRLGAAVGSYRKMLEGSFVQPDAFILDLELASRLTVAHNTMPAYYSKGFEVQSTVQYPFMRFLVGQAGLGIDMYRAGPRVPGSSGNYRYLTVPLMLAYKTAGLNGFIKQGYQATVKVTPQFRMFHQRVSLFGTVQISQRGFLPLAAEGKLSLEPWLNVGMNPGSGKHVVPIHKRFYVGGADSIRGYAYQMAGPLDSNGNPIGGDSSLTFGTELKYYLSETLAILGFVDAGTVFKGAFPDLTNQFMCGVGAGFRYDTPLGTLRLDVASPMRRRSQDSAVQAYIGFDKKI